MSNVKGTALAHFKQYVVRHHGEVGMRRWTADLDPQDLAVVEGILLPGAWYPVRLWNELTDRYVTVLGGGDRQGFRPAAEHIAEADLHTFFKVLLKLGSPAAVLRRAPSLWERYFDVGTMESTELTPSHFQIRLMAPRAVERGPGELTCAVGVVAWQERVLRAAGGRGVRSAHLSCRFRGSPFCEYEISWT